MSRLMDPSHSMISSPNENTSEYVATASSSPSKSTGSKRKYDSGEPGTLMINETSKEQNIANAKDLATPVSTVKMDPNSDSSSPSPSPPTKKWCESNKDNATNKIYTRTRWKAWEKERLIEAFQECTENVWLDYKPPDLELCERILEKFPANSQVTSEHIQTFIYNILTKEHRRRVDSDNSINKWIEVIDAVSPKENIIAKQLELIMTVAKQEPNDEAQLPPSFDKTLPQPNFEAIYDYMSKAFSDKPLPELTPIDSLVVEDLMQSLIFQVESLNDGELRKSLRQVYLHYAQDPHEEPEHDHDELRRSLMHSITVLNPLGLNAQSIVPVPPK